MKVVGNRNTNRGFTIVELLIVIVVIAILAAITVIAFRGIRERAITAQYVSAADAYEKLIKLHYAETGSFPVTSGFVCLGRSINDYPATAGFPSGACVANSAFTWNQAAIDAFSPTALQNFPSVRDLEEVASVRGLVYYGVQSNYASLGWWAPDKSSCGRAVDDWSGGEFGKYAQCQIHFDYR